MSSDVQEGAFNVQNIIPKDDRTPIMAVVPGLTNDSNSSAKPLLEKNNYKELVNPCLGDSWDGEQMKLMAVTASMCLHPSSIQRPQMRECVCAIRSLEFSFKMGTVCATRRTTFDHVLVLIAGLLDDPELALASLAVCMAVMGLLFMVSVGFNAAASVRVSNELGARNPRSAAFSVVIVTLVSSR